VEDLEGGHNRKSFKKKRIQSSHEKASKNKVKQARAKSSTRPFYRDPIPTPIEYYTAAIQEDQPLPIKPSYFKDFHFDVISQHSGDSNSVRRQTKKQHRDTKMKVLEKIYLSKLEQPSNKSSTSLNRYQLNNNQS